MKVEVIINAGYEPSSEASKKKDRNLSPRSYLLTAVWVLVIKVKYRHHARTQIYYIFPGVVLGLKLLKVCLARRLVLKAVCMKQCKHRHPFLNIVAGRSPQGSAGGRADGRFAGCVSVRPYEQEEWTGAGSQN